MMKKITTQVFVNGAFVLFLLGAMATCVHFAQDSTRAWHKERIEKLARCQAAPGCSLTYEQLEELASWRRQQ